MEQGKDSEHHGLMIEENAAVESLFIDPKRARFPCCIVWSPLPFLSWFVPFIGHLGICREDGVILDFVGPNFVCVDNFTFGAPTRYFRISREQYRLSSTDYGSESDNKQVERQREILTWDDALCKSTQEYQHRSYNLLTCNCHSFVANVLNNLCFLGGKWNVMNLAVFIFFKGQWISKASLLRSFLPFLVVFGLGATFGGATFVTYWAIFIFFLVGWFLLGSYCFKKLIHV